MTYKSTYISPLSEMAVFHELQEAVRDGLGPVQVGGCIDSQKVDLMQALGKPYRWQVVVAETDARAKEIYDDYKLYCSEVYLFPGKDVLFFQSDMCGKQILSQRITVLRQLSQGQGGVIVTTIQAMMNVMPPFRELAEAVISVEVGEILSLPQVREQLVMLGYESVGQVDAPGQFSVRGGILDVFPLTEEVPLRVELWDDEVDSIRSFDVDSQRSIEQLERIEIFPASEYLLSPEVVERGCKQIRRECDKQVAYLRSQGQGTEAARLERDVEEYLEMVGIYPYTSEMEAYAPYYMKERKSFCSFFAPEDTIFFLDEPQMISQRSIGIAAEFEESMKNRLEKGYLLPGQVGVLLTRREVEQSLCRSNTVFLSTLDNAKIKDSDLDAKRAYSVPVQGVTSYVNHYDILIKDLQRYRRERYRVVLLCASRTRAQRLAAELADRELFSYYKETPEEQVKPGEIMLTAGNLHRGFCYPHIKFVVLTESDLFGGRERKVRKKHNYQGKRISSLSQLKAGDFVVHERYGLGIYRGIEQQADNGITRDYIKIEYAAGGQLYVLMQNLAQIMKYAAGDESGAAPKLNKLGNTTEWRKTKERVQKHVKEMAAELVKLYSARQNGKGHSFSPDTVWQREFEEMFPFDETEDQLEAIAQTKADMESTKIMDRLICGDVGYGKTEIAIRAAFKAVQDGKQVAYLVPTTILAQQHYNTFVQRMKDYPVRVDQLSRFCTPSQAQDTLKHLQTGMVDIVIGTHRLLSQDVRFKDLGLLVIDEEQRFGVAHKEKIKQMKTQVDVLTLTATPIPRTLHMSLIGVRDMSVLEQAPRERVPIQTYVCEYQDELVREAIMRELTRQGQVYYVYNRVKDIVEFTAGVQKLVPDAVVAYAHGQMSERELERIMRDFIHGDIDVLVSTTIIETGLDISNVNTIIIHDADRFGLSTLYQLRGRVGRSNRMAYAFIMYRRNKILREEAQKRLQAIREFTELGSGVKIALRDLEIRGAGNLLGAEQHGHMAAVGYDLYCKMLNEAVETLRGEKEETVSVETTINILLDAYIPGSYIRNESMRLDVYKRIAAIQNEEDFSDMQDELLDRFGDIPECVQQLLHIALLRAAAQEAQIEEISADNKEVRARLRDGAPINGMKATEVLSNNRGQMQYVGGKQPYFRWNLPKSKENQGNLIIKSAKMLINQIKLLLD